MAQRAQPARGMRDIVPPEAELRRQVANRILDVYAAYGYEVIETPALEDLDVLIGSQGGENETLIFKVMKRGAKLDEELERRGELADMGLRFDLTVPLARFVANHLNDLPMPFKVAHIAPVWRAERPQRGRFREFTQCDIDIVGEASIAAEIELCTATIDALEKIGIRGCTVRLNDRRLLRAAVEHHLGPLGHAAAVYIALDKLDKAGRDEVAAELARAGHDVASVERLLVAFDEAELIGPPEVQTGLEGTLRALEGQGLSVRFDPTLVRGMGYYTGQIFEVSHPDLPYSLAGGGRYDGMMARFGATALPMCGCSIGFERVCELVDKNAFGTGRAKIAVTCSDDEELLRCLALARAKRDQGTVVNVVRRARNIRKQHDDLQKLGYTDVLDGETWDR
ncbi:MAG TPA: histidine--tRNA ligase [Acidimicrobiales bacterium]|nr:histidine--tRNA ligase [Acidimicrobiales bacterium]